MPSKQNSIANLVDIESKKDGGGNGGNGFTNLAYDQTNGHSALDATVLNGTCTEDQLTQQQQRDVVPDSNRTNYIQTLMHLLNGFIGSGILSMPMAFRDGGIVLASALNPVIGIMSCYCIHQLLSINRWAMRKTNTTAPYDYHEVCAYRPSFRMYLVCLYRGQSTV